MRATRWLTRARDLRKIHAGSGLRARSIFVPEDFVPGKGVLLARKMIIDLDPGIGDAVAALLAMLDPQIDLLALTATAGRVSGKLATRNLHGIVGLVDPPKWPR